MIPISVLQIRFNLPNTSVTGGTTAFHLHFTDLSRKIRYVVSRPARKEIDPVATREEFMPSGEGCGGGGGACLAAQGNIYEFTETSMLATGRDASEYQ